MQVEISASGTPEQVHASVAAQVKAAQAGNSVGAWAPLVAIRDYVERHVSDAMPTDTVTVKASVSIEISTVPALSAASAAPSSGAPVAQPEPDDAN